METDEVMVLPWNCKCLYGAHDYIPVMKKAWWWLKRKIAAIFLGGINIHIFFYYPKTIQKMHLRAKFSRRTTALSESMPCKWGFADVLAPSGFLLCLRTCVAVTTWRRVLASSGEEAKDAAGDPTMKNTAPSLKNKESQMPNVHHAPWTKEVLSLRHKRGTK